MTTPASDLENATPERVVRTYFDRVSARDESAFELISAQLRQHATAAQGRDGLRRTAAIIEHDLGGPGLTVHHVVAAGDMVAVHLTLTGTHRGSTMPLLRGIPVSDLPITWTFMHLFRVEDGLITEHWACRDDLGVLVQLGAWPR